MVFLWHNSWLVLASVNSAGGAESIRFRMISVTVIGVKWASAFDNHMHKKQMSWWMEGISARTNAGTNERMSELMYGWTHECMHGANEMNDWMAECRNWVKTHLRHQQQLSCCQINSFLGLASPWWYMEVPWNGIRWLSSLSSNAAVPHTLSFSVETLNLRGVSPSGFT